MENYLKKKSNLIRFDDAVSFIEKFLTTNILGNKCYKYKVEKETTNNYHTFLERTRFYGFLISSEGTDKTIYSNKEFIYLSRVWHDHIHFFWGLNFHISDEIKTCSYQIEDLRKFARSCNLFQNSIILNDAITIINIDIIGQSMEYLRTGDFIEDQYYFVKSMFLNKLRVET